MNSVAHNAVLDGDYAVLQEPATIVMERRLPGPIERVWSYLVDSEKRQQWLAAGAMEEKAGSAVELVWRNDELDDSTDGRPEGHDAEHRMTVEVLEVTAPNSLRISWGSTGGVTFTLEEQGSDVLLTLTHHRVEDTNVLLNVSAGWHAHLDILVAKMRGESPHPFWRNWSDLKAEYAERFVS